MLPDVVSGVGSLFDVAGQERANLQNRDIWRKTQDWQEHMSNTAWQRGVADMRAAGINPMAAFSMGGASSPSGTIGAPMRSPTAGMTNSAIAASRNSAEIENLRKQSAKLDADTALSRAQKLVADEQKKLTANSARKVATDTVATEGTLRHALGTVWDAIVPGFRKRFSGSHNSAGSINLSKGLFGK